MVECKKMVTKKQIIIYHRVIISQKKTEIKILQINNNDDEPTKNAIY